MSALTESVYQVEGMTCAHCRSSVLEEIQELDGVSKVELDLTSGRLEVDGVDLGVDQVRSAVELAGYKLRELG